MSNKIQQQQQQNAATEPSYFFLYEKSFLGFDYPQNIIVFCTGPAILYLYLVFVIFPKLAPTSPRAVRVFASMRYWHNIFMCVFSLACFVASAYEIYIANEFGFYTMNLKDMMPMLCNDASENLKIWYNVFLISKIYEWIDTAMLVWLKNDYARSVLSADKKKTSSAVEDNKKDSTRKTIAPIEASQKPPAELNFLHLYHHATTFWLYLMMYNLPGMLKMGILLNSFVHFFMYLHYAKPLPAPFLITISQIVQLMFGTYVWYLGFHPTQGCPAHKNFMNKYWYDYLSPWLAAPVYLLFFIKFFVQRFILKAIFGIGGGDKKKKTA